MSKDTPKTVIYPFPVQVTESVWFKVSGARVDKAILTVNDTTMGVLEPEYATDDTAKDTPIDTIADSTNNINNTANNTTNNSTNNTNDAPPDIDLKFFGDKPFHGGLANKCKITVSLYVSDGRTPSLSMGCINDSLTWDKVGGNIYEESVQASSNTGVKTRTIVYTPNKCGFRRQ